MFNELEKINQKPEPFEFYTAPELWTDEYTSEQMLKYHLNESVDMASRNIGFINKSVSWMLDYINLKPNSKILDFGCGPGLYTNRFAEKGMDVTGVDFSKRSIEYANNTAKENGLNVDYICENYLNYKTDKKFDLIIMTMCDFCVLSPEQRKTMLNKFKNYLEPGGKVILDVYSVNFYDMKEESVLLEKNSLQNFWSPDDYYCITNTFKYDDSKLLLDKYTIIEEKRTRTVYNWYQGYTVKTLKKEFLDNDLKIENVFSNLAGELYNDESLEIAIIAGKINK